MATRNYLVLDIETIPDTSLGWDAAKEGFPPPPFHEVVTIGALWLDPDLQYQRMGVFGLTKDGPKEPTDPPPEPEVLDAFSKFVGKAKPHMVTYNGRRFDLPVLATRCLRHGVPFGGYYADRDYRYRFSDFGHIDLADFLTDHGAAQMTSLDNFAHLIGLPGKLGVDGSKVQSLYESGRMADIQAYCLQDVVQTSFLFLRTELLRGRLTREAYHERALALYGAVEADERVKPVTDAADRERLLLE